MALMSLKPSGEAAGEAVRDPVENGAVEVDQIDLVHRHDDVAMPKRLTMMA